MGPKKRNVALSVPRAQAKSIKENSEDGESQNGDSESPCLPCGQD